LAANLWLLLQLTDSAFLVGAVGLADVAAILLLTPLGGVLADRLERRLLLQATQVLALVTSLGLWLDVVLGTVQPWHVYLAVAINSAAITFDLPVRQALIPELVPRAALPGALALSTPMFNIAGLIGPTLAGGLISLTDSVAPVYLFDAAGHLLLIGMLAVLKLPASWQPATTPVGVISSFTEGVQFVRGRPVLWQIMLLDFLTTMFTAYRALLPVIARDVLQAGAGGFGLLSSAISLGAVIGSTLMFRLGLGGISGRLVLLTTIAYSLMVAAVGQVSVFSVALLGTALLGFLDAISQTIRNTLVQLETPNEIRGRVSALLYMLARGGPAIGQALIGGLATFLGIPTALALGSSIPTLLSAALLTFGRTLRTYRG
jgi:MFS family permease